MKIILITILTCLHFFLFSQDIVSTFRVCGIAEGRSVLETGNGDFFVTGFHEPESLFILPILIKFDENGNLLWHKEFDENEVSSLYITNVVPTLDSNYIFAIFKSDPNNSLLRSFPVIVKMNEDGDVLFQKELYPSFGDFDHLIIGNGKIKTTKDGNFIFYGANDDYDSSPPGQIWNDDNTTLIKFSQTGNLIWDTSVRNMRFSYRSFLFESDNIFSLFTFDSNGQGATVYPHINLISKDGQVESSAKISLDTQFVPYQLSNGKYLGFLSDGTSNDHTVIIYEITEEGNIINQTKNLKSSYPVWPLSIGEKQNGNILMAGILFDDNFNNTTSTSFVEYSSSGEVLKNNQHRFINGFSEGLINGSFLDNHFIGAGLSQESFFDNKLNILFVKKDLENFTNTIKINEVQTSNIKIINNPGTDFIQISALKKGLYRGRLFDISGNQVLKFQFSDSEYFLSRNNFPSGTYVLTISSSFNKTSTHKVVFF